jgi:hypothetical protein
MTRVVFARFDASAAAAAIVTARNERVCAFDAGCGLKRAAAAVAKIRTRASDIMAPSR